MQCPRSKSCLNYVRYYPPLLWEYERSLGGARSTRNRDAALPEFDANQLISVGGQSNSPAQGAVIPGLCIITAKPAERAALMRQLWVNQLNLSEVPSNDNRAIKMHIVQQAM